MGAPLFRLDFKIDPVLTLVFLMEYPLYYVRLLKVVDGKRQFVTPKYEISSEQLELLRKGVGATVLAGNLLISINEKLERTQVAVALVTEFGFKEASLTEEVGELFARHQRERAIQRSERRSGMTTYP